MYKAIYRRNSSLELSVPEVVVHNGGTKDEDIRNCILRGGVDGSYLNMEAKAGKAK